MIDFEDQERDLLHSKFVALNTVQIYMSEYISLIKSFLTSRKAKKLVESVARFHSNIILQVGSCQISPLDGYEGHFCYIALGHKVISRYKEVRNPVSKNTFQAYETNFTGWT